MKLSEVSWEDIKVGDKVISHIGNDGVVTKLDVEDDYSIYITWSSGRTSISYHNLSEHIKYVG